jgi:thiosulfate/3-mercaptopyruvate sulfurtransferase
VTDSPLIPVRELARQLRDPRLVILDATVIMPPARFDGDYQAESGFSRWLDAHIPGSRFADLLGDLSDHEATFHFAAPKPEVLAHALRALGVDDDKRVVVYDTESGLWAARLWWMLRAIGISAHVLNGGFRRWRDDDQPIEAGQSEGWPGGVLTIREDPTAWTALSAVLAVERGERPGALVCALSPDIYHGSAPTRYARRGHIPGSLSLPARELFDADGLYLDPAALSRAIASRLSTKERPLILYCGGGVSAAANALALTLLGEKRISIYDGSLEEWAADASLPMVANPRAGG